MYICPDCGSSKILQELVLFLSANIDADEELEAFHEDVEQALDSGEYTDIFHCEGCDTQIVPIREE